MTPYLLTAHGQIPLALDSAETFAVLANPDTRPRRAVAAAGRPSPRIDDHQAKVTRQLPVIMLTRQDVMRPERTSRS
jgi:hypothetical protein